MKTLQTYLFVTFFLLGLILITGCSKTEGPTTPEETPTYAGEQALLKSDANRSSVTYKFFFNSDGFEFDFGNTAKVQVGSFSYDRDNPVSFDNGEGFYVVDFNFAPALSFDSGRDIGWVPIPSFDATTVETLTGEFEIENDQRELFDSNGDIVFQIFANPDNGGFTGEIVGGGGSADVTYALVNDRVTICHKPNTPAQKTLVIPCRALAGHVRHGDTVGACN